MPIMVVCFVWCCLFLKKIAFPVRFGAVDTTQLCNYLHHCQRLSDVLQHCGTQDTHDQTTLNPTNGSERKRTREGAMHS